MGRRCQGIAASEPGRVALHSFLMPAICATPVTLAASDRHRLKKMAYGHKTPYRDRQRATIVLAAARGRSNNQIAFQTRMHLDTVRLWRGRFAAGGLEALADRKRPGRPRRFTAVQAAEVKALACQLPAETGAPLSRWSCPELAREAVSRGIAESISASTVRRWLAADALKPWQYRSWIFIRDPDFQAKADRVLGPVCRHLGRRAAGPRRVRDLLGREDLDPGPLPLPSHPRPRDRPGRCASTTSTTAAAPWPTWRYDVHQAVSAAASGHRHRRQARRPGRRKSRTPRQTGVLGRGQGPPTAASLRPTGSPRRQRQSRSSSRSSSAKSWHPRLHRPGPDPRPAPGIRSPLQRHGTAVPSGIHHHRPGGEKETLPPTPKAPSPLP